MATKSFIKTIGEKGLLSDYNTEGKKLLTEDSIDQTYSSTSTKAQSGVAVKTALDSRIPAPTSTTGTQVLKCIDGVVQWVAE